MTGQFQNAHSIKRILYGDRIGNQYFSGIPP